MNKSTGEALIAYSRARREQAAGKSGAQAAKLAAGKLALLATAEWSGAPEQLRAEAKLAVDALAESAASKPDAQGLRADAKALRRLMAVDEAIVAWRKANIFADAESKWTETAKRVGSYIAALGPAGFVFAVATGATDPAELVEVVGERVTAVAEGAADVAKEAASSAVVPLLVVGSIATAVILALVVGRSS